MANIQPIAINGSVNPTELHVFEPVGVYPARWKSPVMGASSESDKLLTLTVSEAGQKNLVHRVSLTLKVPTVVASEGIVTSPEFAQVDVNFKLPKGSTGTTRDDIRVLLANALGSEQVVVAIQKLIAPY